MKHGSIAVCLGDDVQKGDVIGTMACTGYSTGTHLHFDYKVNGEYADPKLILCKKSGKYKITATVTVDKTRLSAMQGRLKSAGCKVETEEI